MASLSRAYGLRGLATAVGMATVAGGVHGTMAASFDILGVKIAIGLAGSIVLIIAGAISARQSLVTAILTGLSMGAVFVITRWLCWALTAGGPAEAGALIAAGPAGWPAFLEDRGISGYWVVEAVSMFVPALIGAIAGFEKPQTRVSSARSSS